MGNQITVIPTVCGLKNELIHMMKDMREKKTHHDIMELYFPVCR